MAAKQNKKNSDGVFIFETKLLEHKKEVSRTIAVPDTWNLYQLAEAIIAAYDFSLDHCFGFFDADAENPFAAVRKYELFTDLIAEGEDLEPTGADSVKETRLNQVWAKRGDSMLFLFDYGDGWQFSVTLTATGNVPLTALPAILLSVGKAPKQYH